ncbi:MAG: hypothetical protein ABF868_08450 [Sporolactobacillus sp.]
MSKNRHFVKRPYDLDARHSPVPLARRAGDAEQLGQPADPPATRAPWPPHEV